MNIEQAKAALREGNKVYFSCRDATLSWYEQIPVWLDAKGDLVMPHPTDPGVAAAPVDVEYRLGAIYEDLSEGGDDD